MSTKDFAYYEEHPEELTDEITNKLMFGGEGDTESSDKQEDEEGGETPESAAASQDSEEKQEEPVVLAKDGKHTIPYAELEQARSEAKRWEEDARNKERLIEQLKEAQAKDQNDGNSEATDELIKSVKDEYPLLAQFMEKLVDGRIQGLQQQFAETLKPLRESEEQRAINAHFRTIRDAHQDFDTLIENGNVQEWVNTLPSYARTAAQSVLEHGTAQDVIDLLTDYKSATGASQPSKEGIAQKASEAITKAKGKSQVPHSLSSIPAAGLPASEEMGNIEQLSDAALMWSFMNLSQDQISERLNRLI